MSRNGYAPKQDAIMQFIIDYKRDHNGAPPTYQEIADELGICSKKNAYNLVQRLVIKGRLALDDKRRIVVPDGEFVYRSQFVLITSR